MKIQDLIFSRERNHEIGTTFFYFSQYGQREATFYGIYVSFLRVNGAVFRTSSSELNYFDFLAR